MAIPQKVINFLDKNKIKYEIIKHKTVYTAFDKAATLKLKTDLIGKTLVLKLDNNLAIFLIDANQRLDKNKIKKIIKAKKTDFVSEKLIKNKLKGVKVGAVPPFGILWKIPTFVDKKILKKPKIIINSGDYNFSFKINPNILKKAIPDLKIDNFGQKER